MNAEHFYNEFKHALKGLGVRWGDMLQVQVSIDGDKISFKHEGLETLVRLPLHESAPRAEEK
jgi:hypothetical protein